MMNIVVLATRIAGTDGVSLEAEHWRDMLQRMGHKVSFVAGQLDQQGIVIPELHFQWPKVVELYDKIVYSNGNYKQIEAEIFELAGVIEGKLRDVFHNGHRPDLLIVPNVFSLPMHFPLAVALARIIEEDKIPTIARNHDFWWERNRFNRSTMFNFFKRWFPPIQSTIVHTVINSKAQTRFKRRTGVEAEIFWDTFDFESGLDRLDSYSNNWRADFGLGEDDLVFLQATRIVPRKRIELSMEFVSKLKNPKAVLVIAGYSGDEGVGYEKKLRKMTKKLGIRCKFIGEFVNSKRRIVQRGTNGNKETRRIYTLWDCYVNCDFVTYPTKMEGFGNQFVESMYFRKPIILTRYPVFKSDIEPLGFDVIKLNSKNMKTAIDHVNGLIDDRSSVDEMVDNNYKIAVNTYSYSAVSEKLNNLFARMNLAKK